MKRNQGFTFIELMITVTIMTLLIGGGIVFMNRFGASQKIESAKLELLSSLRLARNYAMTKQLVNEDPDFNLKYVSVVLTQDGVISAYANGDPNQTYFSKDISPNSINVTAGNLMFSAFTGKLVKIVIVDENEKIVPVDDTEKVVIEISSGENEDTIKTIEISTSGLIDEK